MKRATYQGNHIDQGTKQDTEAAVELDVLDTDLGHHRAAIKFNIALAIPVDVKVHLDQAARRPVNVHVAELERDSAEVKLLKVQRVERRGKHAGKHGLDDLLGHVLGNDENVGPELLNDVIEEAWVCEELSLAVWNVGMTYQRSRRHQRR